MEVVIRPIKRVIIQGNRRLTIGAKAGSILPGTGASVPDPGDLRLIFENKLL